MECAYLFKLEKYMDKVSIILNSYNQNQFFDEAIKSALNQTYYNFELIISENGSTDGSKNTLEKYKNDPKVKILDYKENDIIGKRFNQAIATCTGDYLCFLYSDDYLEKNKLEEQVKVFKNLDKDFGVIYSDVKIINENNELINKRKVIECDGWCLKYQLENIHVFGHIDMVSPLVKKECFLKHKFLENIFAEGEGIFLRIAQDYKFKYLPKTLVNFRDTKFNKGKALIQNLNFHKETLKVLNNNILFEKKEFKNALNKYTFYFYLNVAWGNLRANGKKYDSTKIIISLFKKRIINYFNIKIYLILILLFFPNFIINLINQFLDKLLNVRTKNIFIKNYGGKDS